MVTPQWSAARRCSHRLALLQRPATWTASQRPEEPRRLLWRLNPEGQSPLRAAPAALHASSAAAFCSADASYRCRMQPTCAFIHFFHPQAPTDCRCAPKHVTPLALASLPSCPVAGACSLVQSQLCAWRPAVPCLPLGSRVATFTPCSCIPPWVLLNAGALPGPSLPPYFCFAATGVC